MNKRKIFNIFKVLTYGFTSLNVVLSIVLLPTFFGALQPIFFSIVLIPLSLITALIDASWKKKLSSKIDELNPGQILKVYFITIAIIFANIFIRDFITHIDTFLYNNVSIYQDLTHSLGGY